MEEKIKSLKMTATRLALFEKKIGLPLTRLRDGDLGISAFVALLESAGMTDQEIDQACEELGVEAFAQACMEVLLNSGLFKRAKKQTENKKPEAQPEEK